MLNIDTEDNNLTHISIQWSPNREFLILKGPGLENEGPLFIRATSIETIEPMGSKGTFLTLTSRRRLCLYSLSFGTALTIFLPELSSPKKEKET